jgi:hypothetical protein
VRSIMRRAICARLEKLEGTAPAEMSRSGEKVRSLLGAADRERSQACGSLLPVYYQNRGTAVCPFSSEPPHHRPRARLAPHPLPTPLLRLSWRAIALRKCQRLTVSAAVSLVPKLASPEGCELCLERCLQPLHLKPAALIPLRATPTMIWKVRACLRTSIFVHRSDGRTTNDHVDPMASRHCIVVSPGRLESQLKIVQQ